MKIVQTLVVRDEADIVDAQISYHLNAGVEFVLATDHESVDGTTELLEAYVRQGCLRRIRVQGEMFDADWRTHMAQLAAAEHGADWVINTDADEFWLPRTGTLADAFGAVPEPYGIVFALSHHFAPRPDDGAFFAERMTVRVSPPVAVNDPTSPYRPHLKVAHRADPEIVVGHGAHTAASWPWRAVHNWHPVDVFHFPFRTLEQWQNKGVRRARGDKPLGQYVAALRASEGGRAALRYRGLVIDDETLRRGCAEGSLVVDVRLRDALRAIRGQPAEGDQAGLETDVVSMSVAVRDADLVRLQRHLDLVGARMAALEEHARA